MIRKLRQRMTGGLNIRKASALAIALNVLQILLVAAFGLYFCLHPTFLADVRFTQAGILIACALIIWFELTDIREALTARRQVTQVEDMNLTLTHMESLNNALRAQRHDFLNHLQVVFSLMEMEDYQEAQDYIERIYGDITSLSRSMKSANPAVNALLQVKLAACEKRGIPVELEIQSSWKALSIPGWEMCKVLSNLIDNAMDALEETPEPRLSICLSEDVRSFRFRVANNGPMIPENMREKIFQAGITTKAHGQGMGMYIIRKTLEERNGDITLTSTPEETVFAGFVPKATPENLPAHGQESLQKNN